MVCAGKSSVTFTWNIGAELGCKHKLASDWFEISNCKSSSSRECAHNS